MKESATSGNEYCTDNTTSNTSFEMICNTLFQLIDKKSIMICFDLDRTLLPLHCYEDTCPPYTRIEVDGSELYYVEYTSRKSGLRSRISLNSEVYYILKYCNQLNIKMSLCSKCQVASSARDMLSALGIWDYFIFPQVYNKRKTTHFKMLKECTDIDYDRYLFFDDDIHNIKSCSSLGVHCEHISAYIGLSYESFLKGLTMYICRSNHISSQKNNGYFPVVSPRNASPKHRSPRSMSHQNNNVIKNTSNSSVASDMTEGLHFDNDSASTSDSGYEEMDSVRKKRLKSSSIYESDGGCSSGMRSDSFESCDISSGSDTTVLPRRMSGLDISKYKCLTIPLDVSLGNMNPGHSSGHFDNTVYYEEQNENNKRMISESESYSIYETGMDSDVSSISF